MKISATAALVVGAAMMSSAAGVTVPTVTLSNGVEMPMMAAGVGGDNQSDAALSVIEALGVGIMHIDTAQDYMNLKGVAVALAATRIPREEIFLTSKVPGCGVPSQVWSLGCLAMPCLFCGYVHGSPCCCDVVACRAQGLQPPCFENTYESALADIVKLGTPYVDLLLLHFPPILGCKKGSESCTKIQEQWRALEKLYANNKTRAIGVSNYCQECVECVLENSTITPMVDQMQFHVRGAVCCLVLSHSSMQSAPFQRSCLITSSLHHALACMFFLCLKVGMGDDPAGLRSYLKDHNIVHEGYSPLAHGDIFDVPAVEAVANATNKSAAQVRGIHGSVAECARPPRFGNRFRDGIVGGPSMDSRAWFRLRHQERQTRSSCRRHRRLQWLEPHTGSSRTNFSRNRPSVPCGGSRGLL